MKPQIYCHTIRFYGSTHTHSPSHYQLQISEIGKNGQPLRRAQWDFSTLKNLVRFLKKYFPNSQALGIAGHQPCLGFNDVLAIS